MTLLIKCLTYFVLYSSNQVTGMFHNASILLRSYADSQAHWSGEPDNYMHTGCNDRYSTGALRLRLIPTAETLVASLVVQADGA